MATTIDESWRAGIHMRPGLGQIGDIDAIAGHTPGRIEIGMTAAVDESWRTGIDMHSRPPQIGEIADVGHVNLCSKIARWIEIRVTATVDEPRGS